MKRPKIATSFWLRLIFVGLVLIASVSEAFGEGLPHLQKVGGSSPIHGNETSGLAMPVAPSIQALVENKNGALYAGSFGMGIYRSSNRGQTWQSVNAGLADLFLLSLAVDQDGQIYAGTVRGGVFRLTKGASQWEVIKKGLKRVEVKSLLAHTRGIFAGTGRGVYQWMEAEGRWVMLTEELDQALVSGLAMLDTHILLAATAGKGLFQYDVRTAQPAKRKGSSSDLVDPKERLSHRYFRVVAVNRHQHIYLGAQDGGIFRSTDHGASWSSMSRTLPNDSIRSIVSHSSGLFVGTGRGVYTMTSNDGKWKSINTGLTELSIQTLIMTTQGVLYAGTSAGVFRSDNGGGQWVDVSEGMGKHTERPHPYR